MFLSSAAAVVLALVPAVGAIHSPAISALDGQGAPRNSARRLDVDPGSCEQHEIDFILIEGDALRTSVEGEIVDMLAKVGIKVNTRRISKDDFNIAEQAGDFHMSFSETWGAPYDPHAYAKGWVAQDEGHFQALSHLEAPHTRDGLFAQIEKVLREEEHVEQQAQWEAIFTVVHDNAVMLPLWGARIPTVLNQRRLANYRAGDQQFDYPVHDLQVISGDKSVTIAPGGLTGLFQTVGRLDPHTYRPNEFFSNNWVYEGLLSYGAEGQVSPALASGWTVEDTKYVFTIREGVTFHDGAKWDCSVAKLNFDHVLAGGLRTPDWHGWYGLMDQIDTWDCNDNDEFVITTKDKYYPMLQELSFIRPLRMLSPSSFANGIGTDPYAANSCHAGWGTVASDGEEDVVCAGITAISGTGPFKFVSRTPLDLNGTTVDAEVVFEGFKEYWGGAPDIETLKIVRYEDSTAVKAALEDGSLDVVWGSGVLSPDHINEIAASTDSDLAVYHSDDIQNVLILLNIDDIKLRKTIIHAIDKKKIIADNLGGLFKPVDNVFPRDAPFSDVDIFPRWDYDIEKAELLNCLPKTGDNSAELEAIAELESQIVEITEEKDSLATEKESLQALEESLTKEKDALTLEKNKLAAEKEALEAKVSDSEKQILILKDDRDEAKELLNGAAGVANKLCARLVGIGLFAGLFLVY